MTMMMMVEVIMMIVVVVLVHLFLDQPVFQVNIQETVWNSWLGYS